MAKNKKEATTVGWDQIDIGDQVKHSKWGVGTVLFRSGTGEDAKAIVVFPEEGQKKLMLKFAKLVKVGSTSLKSVEKLKAESEKAAKPAKKAAPKAKAPAPAVEPAKEEEETLDLDELPAEKDLIGEEGEGDVAGFDTDDEKAFEKRTNKDDNGDS